LLRQGSSDQGRKELEAFRKAKSARPAAAAEDRARRESRIELRVLADLARAHLEAARAGEALKLIDEALRLSPGDLGARLLQAQALLRGRRFDDARGVYEAVLRDHPDQVEALWNLGRLRALAGEKREGAALCLRAAEARPFFPEVFEFLASLALQDGVHAERAEEFARKALEQRPSPANFARLAMALHAKGNLSGCDGVIREGLSRYPGDPELVAGMEILKRGGSRKP
ncbi:MAG: tetratricopeptide repeat protein, partial [Thermoanaerobaculia bacterium]